MLLLMAVELAAAPTASPRGGRLAGLVATADAVVIGTISGGNVTAETRELEFTVSRVLKGSLQPGVFVRARYHPTDKAGRANVKPINEAGLMFLKQTSSGMYELLSADSGELGLRNADIHLPTNSRSIVPQTASTLENVYAELLGAAEMRQADEAYLRRIASKLSAKESPIVASAFQRWLNQPSGNLRLVAIGGLLSSGSVQAVFQLKTELEAASLSPLATSVASSLYASEARTLRRSWQSGQSLCQLAQSRKFKGRRRGRFGPYIRSQHFSFCTPC